MRTAVDSETGRDKLYVE